MQTGTQTQDGPLLSQREGSECPPLELVQLGYVLLGPVQEAANEQQFHNHYDLQGEFLDEWARFHTWHHIASCVSVQSNFRKSQGP